MAEGQQGRAAIRTRAAEIGVAAFFFALGALVIYDSQRLGAGWADDGPRPGYFPFYVGLIICISALINVARALLAPAAKNKTFVEVGQLKMVLTVLVPTAIYVAAVGWIGIYVSSTAFIAFFMRWLGKYVWWKAAAVSIGASVVFFLIFEKWFQVPLPKGPLERLLGLG
jgi:putative tricarboxylic transport membrane protein